MTTSPVQRDEKYPREWPDISPLRTECKDLDGTYANVGSMTTGEGGVKTVSLSAILSTGISVTGGETVSIKVSTKSFAPFSKDVSKSTLLVNGVAIRNDGFCIDHCLNFPTYKINSGAISGLDAGGSQQNIWLTRAVDGSLLIKVFEYSAGLIVIVPYYHQTHVWARFERIGD